ncbi:uncharacterized protein [Euphorbia lathyris]|uniref:uncharacterized protein n=1 Tax=Euphorbia lathyris TaxID=212925 RepID=UPI003313D00A
MIYRHVHKFLHGSKYLVRRKNGVLCLHTTSYQNLRESEGETLGFQWYEKAFPHITKLTRQLQNVDLIDGKLVNMNDDSIIIDDRIAQKMLTLKSLVRVFIGSPLAQQNLKESIEGLSDNVICNPVGCFGKPSERDSMIVSSLTKVSDFLNVTAQQKKVVRFTIAPQVSHHRIWVGALKEILNGLKLEIDELSVKGSSMEEQIVHNCLKFLADTDNSDYESTSWMQLGAPKSDNSRSSATWADLLEMFDDLIRCLGNEKGLFYHVSKLEVMKEGLAQIKDVLVDKGIGYKESRFQESLVQKKLSKTLGHSSRCLFTLLLYYLYGHVRDIEVDLCGGIYSSECGTKFCLYMGRILTSDDEGMVWNGVKQLQRALGLYKFVWETAGMKGVLELQGHLWCVGAKDRTLSYRGTSFIVHGISF